MGLEASQLRVGHLKAAADFSAKQFYAVKVNNTGGLAIAAAGEPVLGILQDNPASGVPACVAYVGVTKAVSGGNVTAGDYVASDASGKMKTAVKGKTDTSDAGAAADALLGSDVLGIALEGAVANDIFTILILPRGAVPTTVS